MEAEGNKVFKEDYPITKIGQMAKNINFSTGKKLTQIFI